LLTCSSRSSSTRGHSLKFSKQFSRVNSRAFSFANRCVDVWNSSDNHIVTALSLYSFKARLNCFDFLASFYVLHDVLCAEMLQSKLSVYSDHPFLQQQLLLLFFIAAVNKYID